MAEEAVDGWTFLSAAEIAQLLDSAELPLPVRLRFGTAIFTGLRQSELWALRWDDIDDLEGAAPMLAVRRSTRGGAPKSGRARIAPLLPPAVEMLVRWRRLCDSTDGLVFPAPDGMYRPNYDSGWSDRRMRRGGELVVEPGWKTRAGIERHVRFHDLRHTTASHLVMGTWGRAWRLEEVQRFMGHTSIGVTQRYAHLSPEHMRAAAAETTGPVVLGCPRPIPRGRANRAESLERAMGLEPTTCSLGSCHSTN